MKFLQNGSLAAHIADIIVTDDWNLPLEIRREDTLFLVAVKARGNAVRGALREQRSDPGRASDSHSDSRVEPGFFGGTDHGSRPEGFLVAQDHADHPRIDENPEQLKALSRALTRRAATRTDWPSWLQDAGSDMSLNSTLRKERAAPKSRPIT